MTGASAASCDRCGIELSRELPAELGCRPMQTICTGCAYQRAPSPPWAS